MTEQQRAPLPLRLALRLHPAAYRAEHEAELTAIFAEATAGSGRLGVLREAADLAGHAIRRRTGLGSDRRAGQLAAQAAPLAVAVAAGGHAMNLVWLLTGGLGVVFSDLTGYGLELAASFLVALLWPAVLLAVWTGRWTLGRALALLAGVAAITQTGLAALQPQGLDGAWTIALAYLGSSLLSTALVLAAPRDLLGDSRPQRRVLAAATAFALVPEALRVVYPYPLPLAAEPELLSVVVLAVALLLAGGRKAPGAAVALAVLPLALRATLPLLNPLSPAGVAVLLLLLLAAVAGALRARRSRTEATPPTPA